MRWLTRHWASEAEEDERDPVWSEYQAHLKPLLPSMPLDLADLARNDPQYNHRLWIPDSRLDRILVNKALKRISLRLYEGDSPPAGYGLVTLIFEDAEFVEGSAEELASWVTATRTAFLCEEIDESPGPGPQRWKVGFLLWPEGEFAIAFKDFRYEWTPETSEGHSPRPRSVLYEEILGRDMKTAIRAVHPAKEKSLVRAPRPRSDRPR